MKGYCSKCGKLVDETEQLRGVCFGCQEEFPPKWMIKHDGVITRRRKSAT